MVFDLFWQILMICYLILIALFSFLLNFFGLDLFYSILLSIPISGLILFPMVKSLTKRENAYHIRKEALHKFKVDQEYNNIFENNKK